MPRKFPIHLKVALIHKIFTSDPVNLGTHWVKFNVACRWWTDSGSKGAAWGVLHGDADLKQSTLASIVAREFEVNDNPRQTLDDIKREVLSCRT